MRTILRTLVQSHVRASTAPDPDPDPDPATHIEPPRTPTPPPSNAATAGGSSVGRLSSRGSSVRRLWELFDGDSPEGRDRAEFRVHRFFGIMRHNMREKKENIILEQIHRAEREAAVAKAAEEAAKNPPPTMFEQVSRVVTVPAAWLGGVFKRTAAIDTSSSWTDSTDTDADNGIDAAANNSNTEGDATAPTALDDNANVTTESNGDTPKDDGTRGHVDAGPVASGSGTTSPDNTAKIIKLRTKSELATATDGDEFAAGTTSDVAPAGSELAVTGGAAKFIPVLAWHNDATALSATINGAEVTTAPKLTTTTPEAGPSAVAEAVVDATTSAVPDVVNPSNEVTKTPTRPVSELTVSELTDAEYDAAAKIGLEVHAFPLGDRQTTDTTAVAVAPHPKTFAEDEDETDPFNLTKIRARKSTSESEHSTFGRYINHTYNPKANNPFERKQPRTTKPPKTTKKASADRRPASFHGEIAPSWNFSDDDEPAPVRSYTPTQLPSRVLPPPPTLPASMLAERDAPPTPRLRPVGRIRSASRSSIRTTIDGDDGEVVRRPATPTNETPVNPGDRPVVPLAATLFTNHRRGPSILTTRELNTLFADFIYNTPLEVLDNAAADRVSNITPVGLGRPPRWSHVGRKGNADALDVPELQLTVPTPRTEADPGPGSPMSEFGLSEVEKQLRQQGLRNTLAPWDRVDVDKEEGTISCGVVATRGPRVSFSHVRTLTVPGTDNGPMAPPVRLRRATISHVDRRGVDRLSISDADNNHSLAHPLALPVVQPRARVSFPPDLVTATHPAARTSTLKSFHSEDKEWKYTFKGKVRNAFRALRKWVKARARQFGAGAKDAWRKFVCCPYEDEDELDVLEQGQGQAQQVVRGAAVRAAVGA
ncbi:uncharacterized protein LOC62_05G007545 [Vanrija pseudolonga]|uniref:Uncharacterized protein n=1 Tax=Vanrija pseudolonga TaxID=143232 RepID=A0AAF0YI42_9TREE|nr:hypothetical protein LOC62_05G007545 [Vanrija pseudolonga]